MLKTIGETYIIVNTERQIPYENQYFFNIGARRHSPMNSLRFSATRLVGMHRVCVVFYVQALEGWIRGTPCPQGGAGILPRILPRKVLIR